MDLAMVLSLLAGCGVITYRLGLRLGGQHPVLSHALAVMAILFAVIAAWTAGFDLRWAQLIPWGPVVVLANAPVMLAVGAAGLLAGTQARQRSRYRVAVLTLCTTAAFFMSVSLIRPLFLPVDVADAGLWKNGVCLQSHEATCAPAAVATLLHLHGIASSEKDMVSACLTSQQGTLALGTFRGLYQGVRGQDLKPRVLICHPGELEDHQLEQSLPLVAHVSFERQLQASQVSSSVPARGRWGQGGHAVVVVEKDADGNYLVADPATGHVRWSPEYFRQVWSGEAVYLVSQ